AFSLRTSRHGLSDRQPRGTLHASSDESARNRLLASAGVSARASRSARTCCLTAQRAASRAFPLLTIVAFSYDLKFEQKSCAESTALSPGYPVQLCVPSEKTKADLCRIQGVLWQRPSSESARGRHTLFEVRTDHCASFKPYYLQAPGGRQNSPGWACEGSKHP